MADSFPALIERYGAPELIPVDVLGEFLFVPQVQGDLINLSKMGVEKIRESTLGKEVRRRSKSDLYFLTRYMLWDTNPYGAGRPLADNMVTWEEYQPLFELFIQKDDSKSVLNQDLEFKTRFLLWPRGGKKSTIDCCDAAQWILNFPDIRILFLTATDDLAVGLLDELKGHFVIKMYEPSRMNLFFPEFCVEENKLGNQFEFNCPLWSSKGVKRKEPTVMAASVGGTKSGWHFEVIKADDAVSDKNSETPEQCETVSKKINLARKLLVPGGYYMDFVGTRYDDSDHYGLMLEKNVGKMRTVQATNCLSLTENATSGMRFLIARGIVIKPEVADQLQKDGKKVNYKEAGEEGCDLLLPKAMPYNWLMGEYALDESIFEAQINQNPTPPSAITFDQPLLSKNTVPFQEMPQTGPISHTWDFAFSFNRKKKGRDFCTGSAVRWDREGRGYVLDLVRERFATPTAMAQGIVDFTRKWRPFVIGIEEASGSRLLEPTIQMLAAASKDPYVIAVCGRIDWVKPENTKDAKRLRMATLHPWVFAGRFKFANFLPHLQVLYDEFKKCLTTHSHDDIPDVLSRQVKYAPQVAQLAQLSSTPGMMDAFSMLSKEQAAYNLMFEEDADCFGRIGAMGPRPMPIVDPTPNSEIKSDPYGDLENMLGGGLWG